ncbi:MAG: GTPase ObgE [Deltaproteobacteria bacterium]|nr:GTPase ObgE [Deltaproteobacteria bacterium]
MDRAKIWVKSGHGGAGCVSFRRERFVPRGGPDGGDGGRGGDVIVKAGDQRETLLRYRFNQHFFAKNGSPGMGRNRTGESADDLVLMVPPGTAVLDAETGAMIADLPGAGDEFTVCRGGRGGQGNARFASGRFRTPRFAQPGGDYEERRIVLELRLLADAALVGYPNVGKSSLISRLSAATPKVADYPFTTLSPVLGTVSAGDSSYVMADLPGLIDGASEGLGLGHEFLRHVSRAGVLLHVMDPTRLDPADPLRDLEAMRLELKRFEPSMLAKPALVGMSKLDLPEGPEALKALRKALPGQEILAFSSVTREGLDAVRYAVWNEVKAMRDREAAPSSRAAASETPAGRAAGAAGEASGGPPKKFSSRADALEAASRGLRATGGARFTPAPGAPKPGPTGQPGSPAVAGTGPESSDGAESGGASGPGWKAPIPKAEARNGAEDAVKSPAPEAEPRTGAGGAPDAQPPEAEGRTCPEDAGNAPTPESEARTGAQGAGKSPAPEAEARTETDDPPEAQSPEAEARTGAEGTGKAPTPEAEGRTKVEDAEKAGNAKPSSPVTPATTDDAASGGGKTTGAEALKAAKPAKATAPKAGKPANGAGPKAGKPAKATGPKASALKSKAPATTAKAARKPGAPAAKAKSPKAASRATGTGKAGKTLSGVAARKPGTAKKPARGASGGRKRN